MKTFLLKLIKYVMSVALPFDAPYEGVCNSQTLSCVVPLETTMSFFSAHAIFGLIALVVVVLFVAFLTIDPKKKDKNKGNPHEPI